MDSYYQYFFVIMKINQAGYIIEGQAIKQLMKNIVTYHPKQNPWEYWLVSLHKGQVTDQKWKLDSSLKVHHNFFVSVAQWESQHSR